MHHFYREPGDGLAVGKPSGFVGKVIEELISSIYTVEDDDLYRLLSLLADSEHINIESSAEPGFLGPVMVSASNAGMAYIYKNKLKSHLNNATHIAWAIRGLLVPEGLMQAFNLRGKELF